MDVIDKATSKIRPYVKLIEKGALKGPVSVHILLTDFCVNKCNMCGHWHTPFRVNMKFDLVKKIWDDLNAHECESVCFTGGDPILHPKFNEILDLERSFELGIINTANYKSNFDFEQLRKLAWVRYSIDSLVPGKYAIIRGYDNLESKILPNVLRSREYNSRVGVNFTIQKMNADEISAIIAFCANNKIYRTMLYPMHGDGDLCITDVEIKSVIEQLYKSQGAFSAIPENNFEFLLLSLESALKHNSNQIDIRGATFDFNEFPCIINKIHVSIGADGRVFPCEVAADDTDAYGDRQIWKEYTSRGVEFVRVDGKHVVNEIGNVNVDSLNEIWKRNFDNSFRCSKCNLCFSRYQPIIREYHRLAGKKIFV